MLIDGALQELKRFVFVPKMKVKNSKRIRRDVLSFRPQEQLVQDVTRFALLSRPGVNTANLGQQ